MTVSLQTPAEAKAQQAQELPAFSGVNLLHIKRQVAELLNQIGGNGIFDEYTVHDIRHIDAMLAILDWLIPESTKSRMSIADWLMTVLGILFHDLGLLVTKEEYRDRYRSGFPQFRDQLLFSDDDDGKDYKARLSALTKEESERFLYQEFVRAHHAKRVRAWIEGREAVQLGVSQSVADEADSLLQPLGRIFRNDLALICESHHLDDLDNVDKYMISRPYGNSAAETANLQYAAVLLRTADLLHITLDRTPSIAFRILNPSDPMSQREWAKQMAVVSVRPQLGKDRDGNISENAPRDTIEIHATFGNEEGFFGLTSYLSYAAKQLQQSHDWVLNANKHHGAVHHFPWRYLDDTFIETEGFLKRQFEFTIDQAKILDLLTGHTLYNDTSVVLRELVQNSLDAVRLQFSGPAGRPGAHGKHGKVSIHWDTRTRTLEVKDNGTGMTQEIIENNLLKVGASRYQDSKFRESYPDFTPISRFGIGVLSAFMIADTVEIITCHPDEEEGRFLSLRSVHGKYLIRLLDRENDQDARALMPHGTLVRISVRPSALVTDVLNLARRWVVVPGCAVVASIDDGPEEAIGYHSTKDALTSVLVAEGVMLPDGRSEHSGRPIKILERNRDGVSVAFAVEWSDYFNEWNFLRLSDRDYLRREKPGPRRRLFGNLGISIEGIRVEFGSPGFPRGAIYALANATGPNAPRTNVARSGLEATPEYDRLLHLIYGSYCDHIRDEIDSIHKERGRSLTWASGEAQYLVNPLVDLEPQARLAATVSQEVLEDELKQLPVYILEEEGERKNVSWKELQERPALWTIESAFLTYAENLIRELPSNVSLQAILRSLEPADFGLPHETLLCSRYSGSIFDDLLSRGREVGELRANRESRRLDVKWVPVEDTPRWIDTISRRDGEAWDWHLDLQRELEATSGVRNLYRVMMPVNQIPVHGFEDEEGVKVGKNVYLLWAEPLKILCDSDVREALRDRQVDDTLLAFLMAGSVLYGLADRVNDPAGWFEQRIEPVLKRSGWWERINEARLTEAMQCSKWKTYDTRRWWRREAPYDTD